MKKVEEILKKKKSEIDRLEVPNELETRLRSALKKSKPYSRSKGKLKVKVAGFLIAAILIGYNADTLASYGRKLVGYNEIMDGSLKELNELGKGQIVDKSYTFRDGSEVTLDGIMLDDNQLLAFYTIKDPTGNAGDSMVDLRYMEGKSGEIYFTKGGTGNPSEDRTEMKWILGLEPPSKAEKELIFTFVSLKDYENQERGNISVKLDRNKAMGYKLKKSINEKVKVDETDIKFESIVASPTTTIIKGEIQSRLELAIDYIMGRRIKSPSLVISLIVNGKESSHRSSGTSVNYDGMRFETEFEPLPKDLEQLQIKLVSFGADHDVDENMKLNKHGEKQKIEILDQKIEINKVYEAEGETFVTITTEDGVILSNVYLEMDGKDVELEETILDEYDEKTEGTNMHTRTLRFKDTGDELEFHIRGIKYDKIYNEVIDVPVD